MSPAAGTEGANSRQRTTRHMISTHEFTKMKTGVVIINTARGAVIDEEALVKALDDGKIASAGLDVFENEPKMHPGLQTNRNVLLLPHMGTWSVEVSHRQLPLFHEYPH